MERVWVFDALMAIPWGEQFFIFPFDYALTLVLFFPCRLACSNSDVGLLNPSANPGAYENVVCPCEMGASACPANASNGELHLYRAISTDDFYDLTDKNINLWIVRTYKQMKKNR